MNKVRLKRKRTEYLSEKSRLPSHPELYVLYIGEEHHDETELKLSEELLSGFSAAEKREIFQISTPPVRRS